MIARKLICLLMAFVFALAVSVPALAGDTPPPGTDDYSIHPWDTSDGLGAGGGHTEVYSHFIVVPVFCHFPSTFLFLVSKADSRPSPSVTSTETPERRPLRAASTRTFRR